MLQMASLSSEQIKYSFASISELQPVADDVINQQNPLRFYSSLSDGQKAKVCSFDGLSASELNKTQLAYFRRLDIPRTNELTNSENEAVICIITHYGTLTRIRFVAKN
jgi:hypothetical protein